MNTPHAMRLAISISGVLLLAACGGSTEPQGTQAPGTEAPVPDGTASTAAAVETAEVPDLVQHLRT